MSNTQVFTVRSYEGYAVFYDPASSSVFRSTEKFRGPQQKIRRNPDEIYSLGPFLPENAPDFLPYVCWSCVVKCNLDCPHCIDDKTNLESNEQERSRIANILSKSEIMGVDISGGEPLMLPDLLHMLKILGNSNLGVSLTTNAWLLKKHAAELQPNVDAIRVSIDGTDEESHDELRGPGSFKRAMEGAYTAIDLGIPVQIQNVVMASQLGRLGKVVELAESLGAVGVTFLQLLPFNGGEMFLHEMVDDAELIGARSRLQDKFDFPIHIRTRELASGFRVVRADGMVWQNDNSALAIDRYRNLDGPIDLLWESKGNTGDTV